MIATITTIIIATLIEVVQIYKIAAVPKTSKFIRSVEHYMTKNPNLLRTMGVAALLFFGKEFANTL